jgi:DNA-binding NarL/FixJ family response regulator
MARVLALVPDLLFGSRVQGALMAAGDEVEMVADESRLRGRLEGADASAPAVLVVDLTNDDLDGSALVEALSGEGKLAQTRTLGFYSHVDVHVRERAEQAGFDLVVPRSRMAREGAKLVSRLVDTV